MQFSLIETKHFGIEALKKNIPLIVLHLRGHYMVRISYGIKKQFIKNFPRKKNCSK